MHAERRGKAACLSRTVSRPVRHPATSHVLPIRGGTRMNAESRDGAPECRARVFGSACPAAENLRGGTRNDAEGCIGLVSRMVSRPLRRSATHLSEPRVSAFLKRMVWPGNAVGRWTAAARPASPPDATTAGSAFFLIREFPRSSADCSWPVNAAGPVIRAKRPVSSVSTTRQRQHFADRWQYLLSARRRETMDCRRKWPENRRSGQTGRRDGAWRARRTPV